MGFMAGMYNPNEYSIVFEDMAIDGTQIMEDQYE